MYKTLVIDLDDTLLGEDLKIDERTKAVIQRAKEKGIEVIIATGRMYCSALPYAEKLELEEELITYNGALVKEIKSGKELIHKPVPLNPARTVIDYAEENDLHLNLYLDDILYVNKLGFGARYYERTAGVKAVLINEEVKEFLTRPPTKLLIVEKDQDKKEKIVTELRKELGERSSVTTSKSYFIEIINQEVSKAAALEELLSKRDVTREEVMAVGDSFNDLELINYAGLGVAVDNAQKEVKEAADYVTTSNDECGVAEAIEKFILN